MLARFMTLSAAALLAVSLSACATAPSDPKEKAEFDSVNDPLEPVNRVVFEFNQIVDRFFMEPVARAYRWAVPELPRKMLSNVLYNTEEPVRAINALLQGRVHDSMKIGGRFIINTGVGLAGIADIASEGGLGKIHADFGQTLHTWGAPEGPYMVLPVLGPSNPRDAIGFAADSLAQPWFYLIAQVGSAQARDTYLIASVAAYGLDKRTENLDALEALEKGSLDFYAQMRSVHRQYRNKQLGVSQKLPGSEYEGFEDDAPAIVKPKKKKTSRRKTQAVPAASAAPVVAPATAPSAAATPPVVPPAVGNFEPISSAAPSAPPVAPAVVPPAAPASQPVSQIEQMIPTNHPVHTIAVQNTSVVPGMAE